MRSTRRNDRFFERSEAHAYFRTGAVFDRLADASRSGVRRGRGAFFKLLKLFENSGTYAIDTPVMVLLSIGLNAIALAIARRHNRYQFLTQIGIACGLLLADIHLFKSKTRIVHYAIPINLFTLLAAPIVLRRLGRTKRKSTPARRFAKGAYRAYALAVFNLLILVAAFGLHMIIVEVFD